MKLRDLNAEIRSAVLWFDCPRCRGQFHEQPVNGERISKDHEMRIPFGPSDDGKTWILVSGSTIDDLTLSPSILCEPCGVHGYVKSGFWEAC